MSARISVIVVSMLALLSSACDFQAEDQTHFYDIDSLLTQQIKVLTSHQASLEKSAWMSTDSSSVKYIPKDSSAWRKELEVFIDMNTINKPVNHDDYILKSESDRHNGLTTRSFVAKPDLSGDELEDLRVEYLIISTTSTGELRKISAKMKENNSMYSGTRYLEMRFSSFGHGICLTGYQIDGGQKMFLGDSVQYKITASIEIPKVNGETK
jgi:hypothetical protein